MAFVTVKRASPAKSDFAIPRLTYLEDAQIVQTKVYFGKLGGGATIQYGTGGRPFSKKFRVYENPGQVEVAKNPAATNLNAQDKSVGRTAAGTAQGTATAASGKYYNEATTVTTGSAEGLLLDAATVGKTRVFVNNGAGILKVYPATGEKIIDNTGLDLTANVALSVQSGQRAHFACDVIGVWKQALPGQ